MAKDAKYILLIHSLCGFRAEKRAMTRKAEPKLIMLNSFVNLSPSLFTSASKKEEAKNE